MTTEDDVFIVYQRGGYVKNSRFVKKPEDIPRFLTTPKKNSNGEEIIPAVVIMSNREVCLTSWDKRHHRRCKKVSFPFILHWSNTKKLEYGLAAWPQKNVVDKLEITDDGRCYQKGADSSNAPRWKAYRVSPNNKECFLHLSNVIVFNDIVSVKNAYGHWHNCKISDNDHVIIDYGDNVDLFALDHPILKTFYVEGETVGTLDEIVNIVKKD